MQHVTEEPYLIPLSILLSWNIPLLVFLENIWLIYLFFCWCRFWSAVKTSLPKIKLRTLWYINIMILIMLLLLIYVTGCWCSTPLLPCFYLFIYFVIFFSCLSSDIFKISDSETLRKSKSTPLVLFLFLFLRNPLGRRWTTLSNPR